MGIKRMRYEDLTEDENYDIIAGFKPNDWVYIIQMFVPYKNIDIDMRKKSPNFDLDTKVYEADQTQLELAQEEQRQAESNIVIK